MTDHEPARPIETGPARREAQADWGAEADRAWFLSLTTAEREAVLAEAEAEARQAQADLHQAELGL